MLRLSAVDMFGLRSAEPELTDLFPGLRVLARSEVAIIPPAELSDRLAALPMPLRLVIDAPGAERSVLDALDRDGLIDEVEEISIRCGSGVFFAGALDAARFGTWAAQNGFDEIATGGADPDWPEILARRTAPTREIARMSRRLMQAEQKLRASEAEREGLARQLQGQGAVLADRESALGKAVFALSRLDQRVVDAETGLDQRARDLVALADELGAAETRNAQIADELLARQAAYEAAISEMEARIADLQDQLASVAADRDTALSKAAFALNSLDQRVSEADADSDRRSQELARLSAELAEAEARSAALADEVLAARTAHEAAIAKATEAMVGLEARIAGLQDELAAVAADRDTQTAEVGRLQGSLGDAEIAHEAAIAKATEAMVGLEARIADLQDELAAVAADRDAQTAEVARVQGSLGDAEVAQEAAIAKATEAMVGLEARIAGLQDQLAAVAADRDAQTTEFARLKGSLGDAEAAHEAAQARATEAIEESEAKVAAARDALASMTVERDEARAELSGSREALAKMGQDRDGLQALANDLQLRLNTRKTEQAELRARFDAHSAELERTRSDLLAAHDLANGLQAERDAALDRVTVIETDTATTIADLETSVARLSGELAASVKKTTELETVLTEERAARDATASELDHLKAELEETRAGAAALAARQEGTQAQVDDLSARLAARRSEQTELRSRYDALAGELAEARARLADGAAQQGKLDAELAKARGEVASLREGNAKLDTVRTELRQRLEAQAAALTEAQATAKAAQTANAGLKTEADAAAKRLKELEHRLSVARDDLRRSEGQVDLIKDLLLREASL